MTDNELEEYRKFAMRAAEQSDAYGTSPALVQAYALRSIAYSMLVADEMRRRDAADRAWRYESARLDAGKSDMGIACEGCEW